MNFAIPSCRKRLNLGALDGKPVQALFTLNSPTMRAHLHLLARLSFALRDAKFKSLVLAQAGRDELLDAVRRISAAPPTPKKEKARHG